MGRALSGGNIVGQLQLAHDTTEWPGVIQSRMPRAAIVPECNDPCFPTKPARDVWAVAMVVLIFGQRLWHAAPTSRLIVDANESWNEFQLREFLPALIDFTVELIVQPLPADADDALAWLERPIPLCADESCRTLADLDGLSGKCDAITIKLDKAGGQTEALALATEAKRRGFRIMVRGTIGTSLGIAPALLVAQQAEIVDLDGPLHRASDCVPGLLYKGSTIHPPDQNSWGQAI
jgi:L-alanine-DL-glutamate epimerase-like enolase superfamily enzyme